MTTGMHGVPHVSVTHLVIKYHAQGIIEGRFCFGVQGQQEGLWGWCRPGSGSKGQESERVHLQQQIPCRMREQELGEHIYSQNPPYTKAPCPKDSLTFPNSTFNWGLSLQIHEPLGTFSFKLSHCVSSTASTPFPESAHLRIKDSWARRPLFLLTRKWRPLLKTLHREYRQ